MRRRQIIRNKHQLGRKASLKSLKRYCLEIWSDLVRTRDNNKCILCGKNSYIQAHHLITRKYAPTRFELNCGISLCPRCHALGLISVHTSPWVIYEWLKDNRPEQYKWFIEKREGLKNPKKITLNEEAYRNILKGLLNEFEKISPQVIKRCKYSPFTELEEKEICSDYLKLLSRRDLAVKYGTNEGVIETLLRRNNIQMRRIGRQNSHYAKEIKEKEIYDEPSGKK